MIYAVSLASEGPQLFDNLGDAMIASMSAAAEGRTTAYTIPAIAGGFVQALRDQAPDDETARRATALVIAAFAPAIADPNLVANINAVHAEVGGVPEKGSFYQDGTEILTHEEGYTRLWTRYLPIRGQLRAQISLCDVGGGGRLVILGRLAGTPQGSGASYPVTAEEALLMGMTPFDRLAHIPGHRPSPITTMVKRMRLSPEQVAEAILSMLPAIADAEWWTGDGCSQGPTFSPEGMAARAEYRVLQRWSDDNPWEIWQAAEGDGGWYTRAQFEDHAELLADADHQVLVLVSQPYEVAGHAMRSYATAMTLDQAMA